MNSENKQRIVGIIVLMALVILLIPFLFTSGVRKKQKVVVDEIPMTTEKRQFITQQIQGINNPVTAPISATLPQPTNTQQPPIAPPQNLTENTPSLPPELTKNLPPIDQPETDLSTINSAKIEEPTELVQPVAIPAKATLETKAIKKPVTVTVKKTKVKTIKGTKKISTRSGGKKYWSVQIGSFSDQIRVQKLAAELQKKGFHVFLQKVSTPNAVLTRVLVGHETSKEKASQVAKQLETTIKIKGHPVRNNK